VNPSELFAVIAAALSPLDLDVEQNRDKRIYAAYVAARIGMGANDTLSRRLEQLRQELGI
jgi:hypothetical protein